MTNKHISKKKTQRRPAAKGRPDSAEKRWRPRTAVIVAVAAALLALALAPGFVNKSREEARGPVSGGQTLAPRLPAPAPRPQLVSSFGDRSRGIKGRRPPSWKVARRDGNLRLRSRDRTAVIAMATPASRQEAREVHKAGVRGIRKNFRRVKMLSRDNDASLGGLRARSTALSATNKEKVPLRVLVTSAKGRRLTYLVEVYVAQKAPAQRLAEAQAIINSLRLGK